MRKISMALQDKFRGCMIGALLGDSIGSYFEGSPIVDAKELSDRIDKIEEGNGESLHEITDDTQMAQELADSLIEKESFDAKDLARRFTTRYFADGKNYYGKNVREVFMKLAETKFAEPFRPASEQFGGTGSFGNGAAMRIAPVPLFCFPDLEITSKLTKETSMITHTHPEAIHGALLLSLSIRRCLLKKVDDFGLFLRDVRSDFDAIGASGRTIDRLLVVEELLNKPSVSDTVVEMKLGNDVSALKSVPTAVFCFLRALKPIPGINTNDTFRRTIQYAISLAGDTDTIASMAGSLAGANVGLEAIPRTLWNSNSSSNRAIAQADSLLSIYEKRIEE